MGRRRSGFGGVEQRPKSGAGGGNLHGVNLGAQKHYKGELVLGRKACTVGMSAVVNGGSMLMVGAMLTGVLMAVLPLTTLVVGHRFEGRLMMDRTVAQLTQHRFTGGGSVTQEKNECHKRTPTHQHNQFGGTATTSEITHRELGKARLGRLGEPRNFITAHSQQKGRVEL